MWRPVIVEGYGVSSGLLKKEGSVWYDRAR